MECHWKALFLMAALLPITTADDVTVRLEKSKSPVKVGEQVVFTCYIQVQAEIEINVVAFSKVVKVDVAINDRLKEPIATLTTVSNPYKALNRFRVEKTTEGNAQVYKLTIDGVQLEDGGAYACSVNEEYHAAKLLEVYRIPERIQFNNYNESDVVEVVENEPLSNLSCLVSRVMPHPDVMVTVGNRDVTNDFLTTAKTNIECSNIGISGKTCPLHSNYDMEAIAREFRPTYADNGMRLSCTSKMRVFEQDQVSTSIILDVKHAPKVNCTSPLMIAVNQSSVILRCTIYANPPINPTTWTINKGGANVIRVIGSPVSINPLSTDEYQAVDTVDEKYPSRIESALVIKQSFTKERFQHVYNVNVENELGVANAQVVVKMQSGLSGNSGVTQVPSVFVSLSSTLLMLVSSILLSRCL